MKKSYDVIIIGAGPAGASTALYLNQAGIKPLVVDKASFPREKICGGAISAYSVNRLRELGLESDLEALPKTKINEIVYSSPDGTQVKLPFTPEGYENEIFGYVLFRKDFDNMLFQNLKKKVDVYTGTRVTDLLVEEGQVKGIFIQGEKEPIRASLVVGADGYHSIIARKMGILNSDTRHRLLAVRTFYRNVQGLDHAIELHFADSIVPGYFWIFPVIAGIANVGLGMPLNIVQKKKLDLKKLLVKIIQSPLFKDRFVFAERIQPIQGWHLPIASIRRKVNGNGFLLVGDAAGLVDPFTGEGIGNALASGKIAAESIQKILKYGDCSEQFTALYSAQLWEKLGGDLQLSTRLTKMARYNWLINFVLHRAAKSEYVRDWLGKVTAELIPRSELIHPLTYLKLLFK